MPDSLVTITDLSYRPADGLRTPILRRVGLEILPGERVAIIGANGSGKTTLLKLISGARMPGGAVDGEIIISDTLMHRRGAIGYARQRPALFPWLNVKQNIGFGTASNTAAAHGKDGRLDAHLAKFGCAGLARKYPAQLSGGEAQRVALAQSLYPCPALLLLDEPFSAMDGPVKTAMADCLGDLWRVHGFAAVLVSHDFRDVLQMADRVYVLGRGGDTGSTITRQFKVEPELRTEPAYIKEMLWAMSEATNYQLHSA